MKKIKDYLQKPENLDIIFTVLSVAAVLCALSMFTGQWFFKSQPYNSYVLQAQSWLKGRLDLGQNYSYLELAIYNGKYFVSFPPFPSYVMLPFVAMHYLTCDSLLAFVSAMACAVYAVKIMHFFGKKGSTAIIFALLLTVGSNYLMIAQNAWVWFIAQSFSFTLSLMAIYYALKGKAGLSLFFWACSVGCRPFQAVYIVALAIILYQKFKADDKDITIAKLIKTKWKCLIPMFVVALSYMVLNFARFGNITEFGHNYLPEFTSVKTGQFNLAYMKENITNLFRMPEIKDGKFSFPMFNGFNIFVISPIFFVYVIYFITAMLNKNTKNKSFLVILLALAVVHLLVITAHKTMGGSHFGNRYPCDALPFIFLSLAMIVPKDGKYTKINLIPLMFGFSLNIIGTAAYYMGWMR